MFIHLSHDSLQKFCEKLDHLTVVWCLTSLNLIEVIQSISSMFSLELFHSKTRGLIFQIQSIVFFIFSVQSSKNNG